jgi:hypothetical protein
MFFLDGTQVASRLRTASAFLLSRDRDFQAAASTWLARWAGTGTQGSAGLPHRNHHSLIEVIALSRPMASDAWRAVASQCQREGSTETAAITSRGPRGGTRKGEPKGGVLAG